MLSKQEIDRTTATVGEEVGARGGHDDDIDHWRLKGLISVDCCTHPSVSALSSFLQIRGFHHLHAHMLALSGYRSSASVGLVIDQFPWSPRMVPELQSTF